MAVAEEAGELEEAVVEFLGGVVVVVVVDFDFAETLAAEGGDGVDVGGVVLIDGEEKGVAGGIAVGVVELLEVGVELKPGI